MSDYSHKNIPTLNDIIENDLDDDKAETTKADATENIHDSFSDDLVDAGTAIEAEIGDINDIAELEPADTETILPADEAIPQASAQAVSLEFIVNDIVEQLMPDLEQQLKRRLQQLLEEKLPEENFGPAETATDDPSTL